MNNLYFDHIASTPIDPRVLDAMMPYLKEHFGNPQSLHTFGETVKDAVDKAREQTANLINAAVDEIYFTASGTESNNFALKGLAFANQSKGKHIVVSAIEHQSILHSVKTLEKFGFTVTQIPVDKYGIVTPIDVKNALKDDTILVSIMHANSEIGTIQPISEIAKIVKEKNILFHTDAIASVGNISVDVNGQHVDALSFAANQFYGPKGTAALYIRKGVRILPFIDGGIQESGKRAGTENVPGIIGLGKACELAKNEITSRTKHVSPLRDKLLTELPKKIKNIYATGHLENRLPHHASFCIEFIEGESMLLNLSFKGIAVSSGSACTSKALKASHVLRACGIEAALAQGSIVFSVGTANKEKDIDYLLEIFPPIIEKLRQMSPLYKNTEEF
ncbi:cysteine desulfurase family protein [bacterium]